jgi:type VI secretion system protein ImpF
MRLHHQDKISLPLLRALIDDTTAFTVNSSATIMFAESEQLEDIRINLEYILNTRKVYLDWPSSLNELNASIMNYGLNDFMHVYYGQQQAQNELCKHIKKIIGYFEPRLSKVNIQIHETNSNINRILKLQIEANIYLQHKHETTIFESAFDIDKQSFIFQGSPVKNE